MRNKKNIIIILCSALLVFSIVLNGCSKKSDVAPTEKAKFSQDLSNTSKAETSSKVAQKDNGVKKDVATPKYNSIQNTGEQDRKIVKSSMISMESVSFDKAVNALTDKIKLAGGYIENSTISGIGSNEKDYAAMRNARFTLRIPKQNFDLFLTDVGTMGNIINKSNLGEDITSKYFDTEAHLKTLKIKEDRLLELLKKSGDLKDIILLETELSNVRYEIETLTGSLKKWDNMLDYSTLTVDIMEVKEVRNLKEKPVTLLEKIKDGFLSSGNLLIKMVKGLIVILAALIPFLPLIIALYFLAKYLIKRQNKKNNLDDSKKE